MTTIAYRDGVLAADTRLTNDDGTVCPEIGRKIDRLPDGSLFAYCGCVEEGELFRQSLRKGLSLPKIEHKDDGTAALHVRVDRSIWYTTGKAWVRVRGTNMCSIGTGSAPALAAMRAGLTAKQAVKIASTIDCYSGGRVHTLTLKKPSGKTKVGRSRRR